MKGSKGNVRQFEGVNADLDVDGLSAILQEVVKTFDDTLITEMKKLETTPYRILIATILSLRTRDEQTKEASVRLFALADTPEKMVALDQETIEKAAYPVGFYRNKARSIQEVSQILIHRYGGEVPRDLDLLLELPGVGRKTANLVLTQGFGLPGICVDTHVHRICNRLGYVKTRTPEDTEMELRRRLPPRHWIPINDLLVSFGQNLCLPLSPWCSRCRVREMCARVGVGKSR